MNFLTRNLLRMDVGADYMGNVGRALGDSSDKALGKLNNDALGQFFSGKSDTVAGASGDVLKNLTAVKTNIQDELKAGGTRFSDEAVQAMYRNVSEGGNVNAGLSAAGTTMSNMQGFQALGNSNGALSLVGSMGMGGLVGGGAASIVGGDPMEGVTLGAMAGAAGSIGARAFRESIGDIETSVMKKALGNNFNEVQKAETKLLAGGGVQSKNGNIYMNSGEIVKNNKVKKLIDPSKMNLIQRRLMTKTGSQQLNDGVTVETGRMLSARSQNLNALQDDSLVDTTNLGRVDKFIYDKMVDPKSASIGTQSRFATTSGAMLAGAAFSSARTKDKRRGFNRNRGNRF